MESSREDNAEQRGCEDLVQEPDLFHQRLSKLRSNNWQGDHVNREGQSNMVNREVHHLSPTPQVCKEKLNARILLAAHLNVTSLNPVLILLHMKPQTILSVEDIILVNQREMQR
jgi:hypothetical protein